MANILLAGRQQLSVTISRLRCKNIDTADFAGCKISGMGHFV